MKMLKTTLLCLMVLCSCSGSADDGGNSTLPPVPSLSNNYKVANIGEYNAAVKKLIAGDSITLAKGVWKDVQLVFYGEGTSLKPITLTVEDDEHTTIEGVSNLKIYGNYLVIDGLHFTNGYSASEQLIEFRKGTSLTANNSVLKNCIIENYNRPTKEEKDAWLNLWGRNNVVENCYFGSKTNLGVILIVWPNGEGHNKNYHRIRRNYFAGRPYSGANGAETIRIGTSVYSTEISGTIVEENYFERSNGEVEIISIKSCENKILNNTFFECEGSVTLRHGHRNEIAGNYFIGNKKKDTGGVRVINEGHKIYNNYFYGCMGTGHRAPLSIMKGLVNSPENGYHQVKDVEICFNTWVDCDTPWQLSQGTNEGQTDLPVNTLMANNMVYCTNAITLVKIYDSIDGITFENNLLKGKKGFESGYGSVQGNVNTSLQLSSYPLAVSDVKGANMPIYVQTDIEGRKRSAPSTIGAVDINGAQVAVVQISKNICGPLWYKK